MLVKLECPSCSGALEFPPGLGVAFCMYCGAKVMIKSNGGGPDLGALLELAELAANKCDFEEAEQHFTRVLEANPYHVGAWLGKGLCEGMTLTEIDSKRLSALDDYFWKAVRSTKEGTRSSDDWQNWSGQASQYTLQIAQHLGYKWMELSYIDLTVKKVEIQIGSPLEAAEGWRMNMRMLRIGASELAELCLFIHSWSWRYAPSLDAAKVLTDLLNTLWSSIDSIKPVFWGANFLFGKQEAKNQYSMLIKDWSDLREKLAEKWVQILRDPKQNPRGTLEDLMPELSGGEWSPPNILLHE